MEHAQFQLAKQKRLLLYHPRHLQEMSPLIFAIDQPDLELKAASVSLPGQISSCNPVTSDPCADIWVSTRLQIRVSEGGSAMSCYCCGHGSWHHHWGPHHHGNAFGPESDYGPGHEPGCVSGPRRRRSRIDELESYLKDLEEEVSDIKAELEELRGRPQPK